MSASIIESVASPWVDRFMRLIPAGSEVLDFACGTGRHARLLATAGFRVEAVDRNPRALAGLRSVNRVTTREADLEGGPWSYGEHRFAAVIVTNYLFRPRLEQLLATVDDPGVLIYETFMVGNERFGRPTNPDFLLASQEMLSWMRRPGWRVRAYEEGEVEFPRPASVQRLCAVRGDSCR